MYQIWELNKDRDEWKLKKYTETHSYDVAVNISNMLNISEAQKIWALYYEDIMTYEEFQPLFLSDDRYAHYRNYFVGLPDIYTIKYNLMDSGQRLRSQSV